MKHLLSRPAAITLVVAAGVGVSGVFGLSVQSNATQVTDFRAPLPGSSHAAELRATPRRSQTAAAPRPLRLTIPRLGVAAPVRSTGVESSGTAEIPSDGDDVGWYKFSATPGDPNGSSVFIGHRDTVAEGAGALFEMDQLRQGDRLLVTNRDATLVYGVTARSSFDKQALPASLFRTTGRHVLHLITCGGAYLPESGGYQENLVVTAVLVRTISGPPR